MSAKAEPDQPLKAPAGWEFSGISFWLSLARYRLDQSHDGEWSVYGEGSLGANSLRRRKYWQWSIPEPPDEVPSSSVVAFTISSGTPESIADYKEAMRAALPIDDYAPMLAIRECCGIVGLVHCHQDRPER